MKLFLKLITLLLVLGLSGPFFLRGPDGQPWLDYRDFLPDVSAMGRKARSIAERMGKQNEPVPPSQFVSPASESTNPRGSGDQNLHRWRDTNGQWHFSDEPPPVRQLPSQPSQI